MMMPPAARGYRPLTPFGGNDFPQTPSDEEARAFAACCPVASFPQKAA